MVIGSYPGPQFYRVATGRSIGAKKFLQLHADLAAGAPQLRARRREFGKDIDTYPLSGSIGIELGGYGVILATVLGNDTDRDKLNSATIFDEFCVIEIPHSAAA